jgi:hypothetical protein
MAAGSASALTARARIAPNAEARPSRSACMQRSLLEAPRSRSASSMFRRQSTTEQGSLVEQESSVAALTGISPLVGGSRPGDEV